MRSKTAAIGTHDLQKFRKELLVLILGQPPRGDEMQMGMVVPIAPMRVDHHDVTILKCMAGTVRMMWR